MNLPAENQPQSIQRPVLTYSRGDYVRFVIAIGLAYASFVLCRSNAVMQTHYFSTTNCWVVRRSIVSDDGINLRYDWGPLQSQQGGLPNAYDITLTKTGSYLGNNIDELNGRVGGICSFFYSTGIPYVWFSFDGSKSFQAYVPFKLWIILILIRPLRKLNRFEKQLRAFRLSIQRAKIQTTCETCGYDLRATPDRCPECGAIVR